MGAIMVLFIIIGIGCGIILTITIVIRALLRSNNIGQNEQYGTVKYIDYSTLSYHAMYDDKGGIMHFDGYYK